MPDFESAWLASATPPRYPPLSSDISVDVAIVGGGIAGLSTAMRLVETDRSVALIEADRIGHGTTGHTTAKLTSQHGCRYRDLAETFGQEKARQYAAANEAGIAEIERWVEALDLDAGFERLPNYVYTTTEEDRSTLRDEAYAAQRLGLPAKFVPNPDGPVEMACAVRFSEQAQFDPYMYLLGLAEAIEDRGGDIYEGTRATGLDRGRPCRITTDEGGTIEAEDVVVASLFPFADPVGYFARLQPSRAYLLAVGTSDAPPRGMYLSGDSPPWTFRSHAREDETLLIVGGQSHPPGQGNLSPVQRYERCEKFARQHFSVESIRYRWSAHDYLTTDGVPYIGQLGPFAENVYVATGFNKWGLTAGTAAGMIIAGQIENGDHPWSDVFDPRRFDMSTLPSLVAENATIGKRWLTDRITSRSTDRPSTKSLPQPGEGVIIRRRGRPIAVHRDEAGEIHAVSAVCPHMWCLVDWNDAEGTWDCPCHGSRFEIDGSVLAGPADTDLEAREL